MKAGSLRQSVDCVGRLDRLKWCAMPGRAYFVVGQKLTFWAFLLLAVNAIRCDEETLLHQRLRGERNRKSLNPLELELSDGKLDFLAEDDAPYTAQEVGCIAANMASNMFRNGTVIAAPAKVSSNHSNDYYFMWQRDAAMSMRSLLRVIVDAPGETFASAMSNRTSAIRNQFMSYTLLLPQLWNQSDPNTLCPPWYKEGRRMGSDADVSWSAASYARFFFIGDWRNPLGGLDPSGSSRTSSKRANTLPGLGGVAAKSSSILVFKSHFDVPEGGICCLSHEQREGLHEEKASTGEETWKLIGQF
eukprot:s1049_g31.t1